MKSVSKNAIAAVYTPPLPQTVSDTAQSLFEAKKMALSAEDARLCPEDFHDALVFDPSGLITTEW